MIVGPQAQSSTYAFDVLTNIRINTMELLEEAKLAENRVLIIGAMPFASEFENSESVIADILRIRNNLELSIYYESKSEIFSQSLCLDLGNKTFNKLLRARDRIFGKEVENEKNRTDTLQSRVLKHLTQGEIEQSKPRIKVRQTHTRLPAYVVVIDNRLWTAQALIHLPEPKDYVEIPSDDKRYKELVEYSIAFKDKWANYTSEQGEEIIEVFDRSGYPHGTLPRKAFYTEAYARHVVWMFVFNRKGEVLLHQRSNKTKDNRLLWDKSTGGHVSITDSSTTITAKRELIEEMYLPEDDLTAYVSADIGDVIDYGEWNLNKKPDSTFIEQMRSLQKRDWMLFRATDNFGRPITIEQVVKRRISNKDGSVTKRPTVMKAELFFLIAPPGQLDNEDSMRSSLEHDLEKSAANDHKCISINDLIEWKISTEEDGKIEEIFTADLQLLLENYRDELEAFSDFVEYLGRAL